MARNGMVQFKSQFLEFQLTKLKLQLDLQFDLKFSTDSEFEMDFET